jgi:hypothetical protein
MLVRDDGPEYPSRSSVQTAPSRILDRHTFATRDHRPRELNAFHSATSGCGGAPTETAAAARRPNQQTAAARFNPAAVATAGGRAGQCRAAALSNRRPQRRRCLVNA